MTVCIGAMCNNTRNPPAIMLGVDTRITYMAKERILGKHDLTSKSFQLPFGFCGIVAGTVPDCETLISYLWEYMEKLNSIVDQLQLDHIVFAARNASEQVLLSLFDRELVNKLGMTRNEWIDRQEMASLKEDGRNVLKLVKPDMACLIAGFLRGSPVLIRLVGKNKPEEIPSHTAIGIGAKFALQKLALRTQGPYCSIQRTALGFSEALRHARRQSKGLVGPPAYCLVLQPGFARQFDPKSDVLRKWSRDIKPQNTEALDSDEHWKEFCPLLSEVPRPPMRSGAQTLEQT